MHFRLIAFLLSLSLVHCLSPTQRSSHSAVKISSRPRSALPFIPPGMKLMVFSSPHNFGRTATIPVFEIDDAVLWPLSYTDDRMSIGLAVFFRGKLVATFELRGSRYAYKVEVTARALVVEGQAEMKASLALSELAKVGVSASHKMPMANAPKLHGMTVAASGGLVPTLKLDDVRVWPFAFRDERKQALLAGFKGREKVTCVVVGVKHVIDFKKMLGVDRYEVVGREGSVVLDTAQLMKKCK